MTNKDVRELVGAFRRGGWTVEMSGKGHYKMTHPDVPRPYTFGASPSDVRWRQNLISSLRRDGVAIPSRYDRQVKRTHETARVGDAISPESRWALEKITKTFADVEPEPVVTVTNQRLETKVTETSGEGQFETWVPPTKAERPPRQPSVPHMTITNAAGLYLSKAAIRQLGTPERVNVSVNRQTAEMLVWNDVNGALFVNYGSNSKRASGTIGATALVRHFDLPLRTRWRAVAEASAPGRILFQWQEEE